MAAITKMVTIGDVKFQLPVTQATVEEKRDTKLFQLYSSSLFGRRMPYVLIGEDSTEWICTNIIPESIMTYRASIEDNIHFLKFVNNDTLQYLHNRFPILKQAIVCLNINDFFTVINRVPLVYVSLIVDKTNTLQLKVTITKKEQYHFSCGYLINQTIIDRFNSIKTEILTDSVEAKQVAIDLNTIDRSKMSFAPVAKELFGFKADLNIPLLDGLTNICINEYSKKAKCKAILTLYTWSVLRAIHAYIVFQNDHIRVVSIRPLAKWFPKK